VTRWRDHGRPVQRWDRGCLYRPRLPRSGRGGPIGLLRGGDRLRIDFPNRRIDILVSEAELAERKQTWTPVKQELTGWLARYQKLVSNASQGGVLG